MIQQLVPSYSSKERKSGKEISSPNFYQKFEFTGAKVMKQIMRPASKGQNG